MSEEKQKNTNEKITIKLSHEELEAVTETLALSLQAEEALIKAQREIYLSAQLFRTFSAMLDE